MGPEADWEADAPPASSMAGAGVQHERHGSRDRGQVQLEADEASHRRPPATEGGYGRMITSISVRVWGCSELPYARRLAMLLSGQVLSLLLVTTGATSALLVGRGLAAPTFVAMCNYLMLTVVYGGTLLCSCQQQSGFLSLWASPEAQEETPRDRHLIAKLILFALADVEANYLIVRAYQYAPMTNITLLDALTIPTVVLLSTVFLGVTYARTHVAGISMCLLGLFCLVAYDVARVRDDQKQAARNILGDLMAVSAAVCYGISNILQEHLACRLPLQRGPHQSGNMNTHARTHARARTHTRMHTHAHTHAHTHRYGCNVVLTGLGVAGAMVSAVQLSFLPGEMTSVAALEWSVADCGLLAAYVGALWLFYSMAPVIMMHAGSAFFNLSLLTSDFWAAVFGALVLREPLSPPYLASFVLTVTGLSVYHLHGEPLRPTPRRLSAAGNRLPRREPVSDRLGLLRASAAEEVDLDHCDNHDSSAADDDINSGQAGPGLSLDTPLSTRQLLLETQSLSDECAPVEPLASSGVVEGGGGREV